MDLLIFIDDDTLLEFLMGDNYSPSPEELLLELEEGLDSGILSCSDARLKIADFNRRQR